jgi:hypothetical protein
MKEVQRKLIRFHNKILESYHTMNSDEPGAPVRFDLLDYTYSASLEDIYSICKTFS